MIPVEICYVTKEQELLIALQVPENSSIARAIILSGILEKFPEIDLHNIKTGIFSRKKSLHYILKPGDRIEIYRPLVNTPNNSRLMRQRTGL